MFVTGFLLGSLVSFWAFSTMGWENEVELSIYYRATPQRSRHRNVASRVPLDHPPIDLPYDQLILPMIEYHGQTPGSADRRHMTGIFLQAQWHWLDNMDPQARLKWCVVFF